MAPKPLLRIRSPAKKTFGETFGAATGVSDPRLQKLRIRNNGAGGKAATVAGYVGPGFHTWPPGPPIKRGIGNAIVPFAPTGQRIPAHGIRPGNHIPENRCVLKEHRIGKAGVEVRDTERHGGYAAFLQNAELFCRVGSGFCD